MPHARVVPSENKTAVAVPGFSKSRRAALAHLNTAAPLDAAALLDGPARRDAPKTPKASNTLDVLNTLKAPTLSKYPDAPAPAKSLDIHEAPDVPNAPKTSKRKNDPFADIGDGKSPTKKVRQGSKSAKEIQVPYRTIATQSKGKIPLEN
ncbi:Pre-mRNA-splicing factor [Venturia inaequalis]|nr:Pre-mRNA-splicing factor [Venturia inaequalis]